MRYFHANKELQISVSLKNLTKNLQGGRLQIAKNVEILTSFRTPTRFSLGSLEILICPEWGLPILYQRKVFFRNVRRY